MQRSGPLLSREDPPASDELPIDQWIFPLSALRQTPSKWPLEKQMYERARGVEFLYRLGSSLQLHTPAMFTAATWFHRFYMRFPIEDFHRQDVAAACIFLATKTEECGRKLRDVARVCQAKIESKDINAILEDSKEVENCQQVILQTEEVLLEALCFEFSVDNPHSILVDAFVEFSISPDVQEVSWTLAHDSYRTPACILWPSRIIAAACLVLAECFHEGANAPSLAERITPENPSPSPSNTPPHTSKATIAYFHFSPEDLVNLSDCLNLILEFYGAQDFTKQPHLASVSQIAPPASTPPWEPLFKPWTDFEKNDGVQAPAAQPSAPPPTATQEEQPTDQPPPPPPASFSPVSTAA
ncbi:cyclin-like protein [Cylindrobasidium torrendii FP15055 ss-10]|uniref:Cyclin-like protein n=1 Tax=Cylindrobasidium torrendii FP15055 ss-10 TaxID=1314674 RepID=A0A0D7B3Y5_9AGAR|nr:cyclin-like protein [Cylindrobasidium torrendii FP15055 ss-10]